MYALLAILNSKLLTFYHFNASPKATKGAFPKILVCDINSFPLPKLLDDNLILELTNLVKALIKTFDNSIDEKIDAIIYKLYDLTEDDVSIVENYFY